MSNTFTSLAPILFSAAQEVSQEPIGFLDGINLSFDDKGVALDDVIKLPLAPAAALGDYAPAMTTTAGSDKIAQAIEVKITASKSTSWHLTGEQQLSLQNANSDKEWVRQLIAQGMRTLNNAAEAAAAAAAYKGASRAYGSAGTTPFTSDINDIAAIKKMLRDNGAPMADAQIVFDTAAGFNLGKLAIYQQAQAAGSDAERRSGLFGKQFGFSLRESGNVAFHTKGTATGMDSTAVEPIGEVVIDVDGSDSGTILEGDVIINQTKATALTDLNKYVVTSATASGAATGLITLNRPGLKVATAIDDEYTIGNSYRANVAFERSAIVGAMRPPIIPDSPLIKKMMISDSLGRTYLLCEIVGDGMVTWRLHVCYGFKAVQPEHIVILLG